MTPWLNKQSHYNNIQRVQTTKLGLNIRNHTWEANSDGPKVRQLGCSLVHRTTLCSHRPRKHVRQSGEGSAKSSQINKSEGWKHWVLQVPVSSSFLQGQPQVTHCKVGRDPKRDSCSELLFFFFEIFYGFCFFTFFSTNCFKAKLISSCWYQHIWYNTLQQKQECLRMNRCLFSE